jgi:hypothetical protein
MPTSSIPVAPGTFLGNAIDLLAFSLYSFRDSASEDFIPKELLTPDELNTMEAHSYETTKWAELF